MNPISELSISLKMCSQPSVPEDSCHTYSHSPAPPHHTTPCAALHNNHTTQPPHRTLITTTITSTYTFTAPHFGASLHPLQASTPCSALRRLPPRVAQGSYLSSCLLPWPRSQAHPWSPSIYIYEVVAAPWDSFALFFEEALACKSYFLVSQLRP